MASALREHEPDQHSASAQRQRATALRSIELFTGAGGLALGAHVAGFENAALVEWNGDACETLRANAALETLPGIGEWHVLQADVRTIDYTGLGTLDLVAGGPPCQPFSVGGKHRGMEDGRNMIPEFIRAIRTLAPRAFIMENVLGLTRPAFAEYFSYVRLELSYPTIPRLPEEEWVDHLGRLREIDAAGTHPGLRYNVSHRLVNAADYGIPQTRRRVFIVGFRSDQEVTWQFPDATHSQEALWREQWVTGEYWERHGLSRPATPHAMIQRVQQLGLDSVRLRAWHTTRDAITGLPEPRVDAEPEGIHNHTLIPGARSYAGHTGSSLDAPSKTLKAGVHGVPGGENMIALSDGSVRYFTVREAARIQTFPDSWVFKGAWGEIMRQLGNAVPMQLATLMARGVAEALRHDPSSLHRDKRGSVSRRPHLTMAGSTHKRMTPTEGRGRT